MGFLHELRKRARQVAPQVLLACLAAYFGYHAVQGDRGMLAWHRLEQEISQAGALRDGLVAERRDLERKVSLLRPDNLDPDLLEERARLLLNYGYADDFQLLLPEGGDASAGGY